MKEYSNCIFLFFKSKKHFVYFVFHQIITIYNHFDYIKDNFMFSMEWFYFNRSFRKAEIIVRFHISKLLQI